MDNPIVIPARTDEAYIKCCEAYNKVQDIVDRVCSGIDNAELRTAIVEYKRAAEVSALYAAENNKLIKALAGLIPWAGVLPEGPGWATPEAKAKNRQMCEAAINAACACFPENYNGFEELSKSN